MTAFSYHISSFSARDPGWNIKTLHDLIQTGKVLQVYLHGTSRVKRSREALLVEQCKGKRLLLVLGVKSRGCFKLRVRNKAPSVESESTFLSPMVKMISAVHGAALYWTPQITTNTGLSRSLLDFLFYKEIAFIIYILLILVYHLTLLNPFFQCCWLNSSDLL